jgi:hypothetical protein
MKKRVLKKIRACEIRGLDIARLYADKDGKRAITGHTLSPHRPNQPIPFCGLTFDHIKPISHEDQPEMFSCVRP